MSDETEDLWAIIASRDAALAGTHRLYQKWIADLTEANASTKAYLAVVEEDRATRLSALQLLQKQLDEHGLHRHQAEARVRQLEDELAGTLKYLATVEADRAERLRVIERLQALLDGGSGDAPAPPATGDAA